MIMIANLNERLVLKFVRIIFSNVCWWRLMLMGYDMWSQGLVVLMLELVRMRHTQGEERSGAGLYERGEWGAALQWSAELCFLWCRVSTLQNSADEILNSAEWGATSLILLRTTLCCCLTMTARWVRWCWDWCSQYWERTQCDLVWPELAHHRQTGAHNITKHTVFLLSSTSHHNCVIMTNKVVLIIISCLLKNTFTVSCFLINC